MKISFENNEELIEPFKKFLDTGETTSEVFYFIDFFFDQIQNRGKEIWEVLKDLPCYKYNKENFYDELIFSDQDIKIKTYSKYKEKYEEISFIYNYFDDDFLNEAKEKTEKKKLNYKKKNKQDLFKK